MQGDYGAKIVALLRRLIWLQENEPDIKSLVRHSFSCSYPAVLYASKNKLYMLNKNLAAANLPYCMHTAGCIIAEQSLQGMVATCRCFLSGRMRCWWCPRLCQRTASGMSPSLEVARARCGPQIPSSSCIWQGKTPAKAKTVSACQGLIVGQTAALAPQASLPDAVRTCKRVMTRLSTPHTACWSAP